MHTNDGAMDDKQAQEDAAARLEAMPREVICAFTLFSS